MTEREEGDGEKRVAKKIQDVGKKRGVDVMVERRDEGFVTTMRSARTDVRSDMINGMPTRMVEAR